MLKHDNRSNTKHVLDMMYSLGIYPVIDKPTRITDISATLIDNIFTNELRNHIISVILLNDISDHITSFATCEYKVNRNVKKEVKRVR